jgi:hypothetical protein
MSSHRNFKFPTLGSKVVNPTTSIGTLGVIIYLEIFFEKKVSKKKSADPFSRIMWSTQILPGPACLTRPKLGSSHFVSPKFYEAPNHRCLFVCYNASRRDACICELYWHSIYKVSIIIPSTRSALPPGLSQNPRGIPQPRIASPPRSEAQDSSSQPARPIVRSRFDT